RANVRLALGNGEGAVADCDAALAMEPENLYALVNRGTAQRMLGHFDKAVADYERAASIDGDSYAVNRNLALLLAACPDEKYLDGARALKLAKQAAAATDDRDSWSLSALAAASAETGDFNEAVRFETAAIEQDKLPRNLPEHKRRLESYQAKKPYRFKVGEPVLDD
ncbi:MAG TPA: tetratricopeptide repeat protein, partial [Pirellulales bacterium]|nr:tetratricopeptide repeat protein [Pirellulales bacterium]